MKPARTASSDAERLGTQKISRLIAGFALTAFAGLLLNSVYSLTDALFVSWGVGNDAAGGISAVYPFVILQGAISTAIGTGAATLVSRRLGEGDAKGAAEVTASAMTAFYCVAALITATGFALMPRLLAAMGATGALAPYAKTYFSIILAGNVFSTGFSSVMRAEGNNRYSLLIWVIPITLNIVLDALFILVLKMGVAGSAAATVLSQFASFVMCVVFFTRFTVQRFKGVRPSLRTTGEIVAVGIPSLVQMGSLSLICLVVNSVLSKNDGATGVTAFGYVTRLMTYSVMPVAAVAQALAPVAGYNFGAGNAVRVRSAVNVSIAASLVCGAAVFVLAEACAPWLMRVFTSDVVIVGYGAECIRITAAALPLMPVSVVTGAAAQSVGRKALAVAFYAAAPLAFLPFAFVLSRLTGTEGLWWAYVCAYAFAALFSGACFYSRKDLLACSRPYVRSQHPNRRQ